MKHEYPHDPGKRLDTVIASPFGWQVHTDEGWPEGRAGLRPLTPRAAEQGRTVVPQTQGLLAQLHKIQQSRRDGCGFHEVRSRRRNDL